jgi:hypothetical protein
VRLLVGFVWVLVFVAGVWAYIVTSGPPGVCVRSERRWQPEMTVLVPMIVGTTTIQQPYVIPGHWADVCVVWRER